MTWKFASSVAAAVAACSIVTFAQTAPQQQPAQPQAPAAKPAEQSRVAAGEQVTLIGCIQKESDYRDKMDAGRGGVAGTGVGTGNEFVLINASMAGAAAAGRPGAADAAGSTPTGTAGTTASGASYELTGSGEGQAEKFIGRRVEISGMLKPAETGAGGAATGGPTAGRPPSGVDATSKDLQLREVEVSSIREASGGSCQ
jgi:hypothetical protein